MSRPFSAMTTSSNFGLRPNSDYHMNPKIAHYHSNGLGRDSYIKLENGGFRKSWTNSYNNIYKCDI